jgi:hypothetical protein
MVDLVRKPGGDTKTIEVAVSDDESDPQVVASALARVLKKR